MFSRFSVLLENLTWGLIVTDNKRRGWFSFATQMSTTDSDRIRQALGGLERCVGDSPDAGKYVFTTVKLPNNTDTTVKIQDISSLTKLTELRHLQLSGQAITDLSVIVGLPFLAELHVDHNELDMSIENCAARWCKEEDDERAWNSGDRSIGSVLEVVNLSFNKIVGPIGDHSKHRFLRSLDLSNNPTMQTLGPGLSKLANLKHLNIANNGISAIKGTALPTSLTSLNLSSNGLQTIDCISHLFLLEIICLDANCIRTLSPLAACSKLRICSSKHNVLSDFETIQVLEYNEHLQELSIAGNPLCAVEFVRLRVIAMLQQLRTLDNQVVDATDKVKSEVLTGSEHEARADKWNEMVGTPFIDMVEAFQVNPKQDQKLIQEAIRLSAENVVANVITNSITPRVDTAGNGAQRPR